MISDAVTPENDLYPPCEGDGDPWDFDEGEACGRWDNGRLTRSCALAGTEFCDFDCPYRGTL